jgi:predicted secreted hydrolase
MGHELRTAARRAAFTFLSGIALASLALSCSNDVAARPIPAPAPAEPTPAPRAISIPADERGHDERLEWWYYNGHLESVSGEEFGFHFVIFQSLDDEGEPLYAAQFSMADVQAGEHHLDSRVLAGTAAGERDESFVLAVSDWSIEIGPDSHRIIAAGDGGFSIDLTLGREPDRAPVLHNEIGWFEMPAGWSYYYSWPNMPASGTLEVQGREYRVNGTGWFDHQWGDFFTLGAPGGWQWMGLRLGGGETLMITETRNSDGAPADTFGTLADADGHSRPLTEADGIKLEVTETWHSERTGADYPSKWRLEIESLELDLVVEPLIDDQEVDEGIPQAAIYWEGKVTVGGLYGERQIAEQGYVELAGYVQSPVIGWRVP